MTLRARLKGALLIAAAWLVLPVATAPAQAAATSPDGVSYVYMLDSAYAPSPAQVRASGAEAWAGYLPAPDVYHAWSVRDFANVESAVPVLPIFVGIQGGYSAAAGTEHGREAVTQLRAYGLPSRVALDVETGGYDSNPTACADYVRAWAAAVRAAGVRAYVYAPLGLTRLLSSGDVDGEWVAYWTNRTMDPEQGPVTPYKWTGERGTQYQGGHTVAGVDVDASSVDVAMVGLGAQRPHIHLAAPMVGVTAVPGLSEAAWEVGADGGVFAANGAPFYGSMGGHALAAPVVGIAPTPDGRGYWLTAADGGVFSFGDAQFFGSMAGHALNKPVIGIVASSTGRGYTLVAADGGTFNFGDDSLPSLAG